jgi:hypothetical protein
VRAGAHWGEHALLINCQVSVLLCGCFCSTSSVGVTDCASSALHDQACVVLWCVHSKC